MVSTKNFLIAQAFGLIALVLVVISFQINNKKKLVNLQAIGKLCNIFEYAFLHAFSGAMVFVICVIRNYVFNKYEKVPIKYLIITILLVLLSLLFTYDGLISLLPVTATCIYTYALWKGNLKLIRRIDIITCSIFLLYTLRVSALMSFIATLLELTSSLLAIYRYDIKKIKR